MIEFDKKISQKEWENGQVGDKRPIWVTHCICELFVNATPSSAIPLNLKTLALYSVEPKHKPPIDYVHHCHTLVKIIGNTITALKLVSNPNGKHIFFDTTTRR